MFLLQIGAKYVYQQTQTGPNLYILLLHQVSSKHVKKKLSSYGSYHSSLIVSEENCLEKYKNIF